MDLDVIVINSRHFKSKEGKVCNTIDFILVTADGLIENDKFVGYIPQTAFFDVNCLQLVKPLATYKGHFESEVKGLKLYLKLKSLKDKDGKVINLA